MRHMKNQLYLTLVLSAFLFASCSKEKPNAQAPKLIETKTEQTSSENNKVMEETKKSNLPTGSYRYYGEMTKDLNCQPSKPWACVSIEEFKKFCTDANGISMKGAISAVSKDGSPNRGALYLLENGAVPIYSISWQENKRSVEYSCLVTVTVEGLFEGSQFKKTFESYADTFLVNNEKDVLVHGTGTIY